MKSKKQEIRIVNRVIHRYFKDVDFVDEYYKFCETKNWNDRSIYSSTNIRSFAYDYADKLIYPNKDDIKYKYSHHKGISCNYAKNRKWYIIDRWYGLSTFIYAYIYYKLIKNYVVSLSDGSQITVEAKDKDSAELSAEPIIQLRNNVRSVDDRLTVYCVTETLSDKLLLRYLWYDRLYPIKFLRHRILASIER